MQELAVRVRSTDDVCRDVVASVEEAVAMAVVDIETKRLLFGRSVQQIDFGAMVTATVDAFTSPVANSLGKLWAPRRREGAVLGLEEAFLASARYHQFMALIRTKRVAVVLVTTRKVDFVRGSATLLRYLSVIKATLE